MQLPPHSPRPSLGHAYAGQRAGRPGPTWSSHRPRSVYGGIVTPNGLGLLVAATIAAWAVWGVVLKVALGHGDAFSLILWSSLFSVLMVPANWLLLRHLRIATHSDPGLILWAAAGVLVSGVAVWTYPMALARGSASIVTALTAGYPAVTLVLATVFLRERPSALQVGGILLTAAGLMLLGR